MLRYGLGEIEAVAPQPGEDEALASEQSRLMDLDELRRLAGGAHEALSGSETDYDAPSVVSLVGSTRKLLNDLAHRDPAANDLASRATELGMLATDLAAEVAGYVDDLVADPLRLEAVGERRQQLAGLTRKYGPTIDEVLAWAESSASRLATLVGSDERIAGLRGRIAELDASLASDAAAISAARHRAADELARAVKVELAALAMPHAELHFDVTDAPLGPMAPTGSTCSSPRIPARSPPRSAGSPPAVSSPASGSRSRSSSQRGNGGTPSCSTRSMRVSAAPSDWRSAAASSAWRPPAR
ncbi:DNA repair protein RecN [Tessaracoccus coleopterorum]|uniref:hypothetical protein n=1 Tax=Tessaracoccus coleopterorum TaxID=2714950 RepID=UPI002F90E8B3